jgi:predicted PurR-regulated permease PerM
LIIGLTIVAIIAALLIQFREIIGPLILSFVLAFLLHPIATFLNKRVKISWRTSVALVFLVVILIIAGLLTLAGFAITDQVQSLILFLQDFFTQLPQLIQNLAQQTFVFGPFRLDMTQFDLTAITNPLLSSGQAILGQVGGLVSTVATSAISTLGYLFFILLIAYFLLADGGQVRENLVYIEIPRYDEDMRRLGRELTRIWEIYLRSQVLIFFMTVFVYYVLMTILGMRFSFGIALLAGVARFVPYLGPFIVWLVTALLAFFGPSNYFNLQPWAYTLLVIGLAVLVDQIFDQYIVPRMMGRTLGLHPAAILVAAIVSFQLLGFIGLLLAAPVLATLTLFTRYTLRKMFDLDPWPNTERGVRMQLPPDRMIHRARAWWRVRSRKP